MTDRSLETGLDYAECPDCHREISLRKDGTLRKHSQWIRSQVHSICSGSGKKP